MTSPLDGRAAHLLPRESPTAERSRGTLERLVGEQDWAISVVTVSELLHGVHRASGDVRARRRAFVEELLAGAEAVPITVPVARVHAELWVALAAEGTVIGQHDLWIAATALTYGFHVATRDRGDFECVPGVRVVAAD